MVKRIFAVITLVAMVMAPVHAQSQSQVDGFRVPFLILVAAEHVRVEGPKCYIATAAGWDNATLEAAPTPYDEIASDSLDGGRMVTASQSPIPEKEGCLLEYKLNLKPAKSYELQLVVNDRPNDWAIDLGEMPIGDIILQAPRGIMYYFDADTFATGTDAPEPVPSEATTPDTVSDFAPVSLIVMISDEDLWQGEGNGCVGSGDASWLTSDASITIAPADGSTDGHIGTVGVGSKVGDDTCSWSFPKTPPIPDTGAFTISIDDHHAECSVEDMSRVGDIYVAAIFIGSDGINCATVS